MAKSIMQTEKECYVTGSTLNLHKHHIFGGPFRKKAEKWGLWVYLRADYHIQTPNAVHNNREFDLELKKEALRLRDEKMPVTLIDKVIYGVPEVAELRFKRDIADTVYQANIEAINSTKLQMRIIENQIAREWSSRDGGL